MQENFDTKFFFSKVLPVRTVPKPVSRNGSWGEGAVDSETNTKKF
jgi:hypothetical protein